ncbi:ABC transporter, partial [Thermus antranikianii]
GEAQLGTLEHMALARGGLLRQLLLRALVQSLFGVLWSLLVLLPLALAFGVTLGPLARWPLGFLPLFLAALGFGLLMGATALYFKQVDEFFTIVQFLFLPYFFYLVRFEPWMAHLPFAPGVHLLRLSLSGAEAPWGLLGLALFQGLLLFALGLWAMAYMYRLVRRRGILGRF